MSKIGRRTNDRIGAQLLRVILAEVRRRRPDDWAEIGFDVRVRARVGRDGEIVIAEPAVNAREERSARA